MADPLVTPAIVGYLVTQLFTTVVDAAGSAIHCKEECKTLEKSLKRIEPLLDEACKHSDNGNATCTLWLTKFKSLLEKAQAVTNECLKEMKSEKFKRGFRFWHWKKLPNRVKKIDQQVQKQIADTSLVTLGILLSMNDSTTKKPLDFEPQQTPLHIVGHEEHFNKLKASILESREKCMHSYFGLHGRGGAGKTVLAKRLHNDEDIKATYGEHSIAWITVGCDARVSQVYGRMASLLNDDVYKENFANQCLEDQRTHLLSVFAK
jgi:transcriptional regulator with PAS, ATPase and Fis domain